MAKSLVKSFNDILRIRIGNCYVRKDCVEMVNNETPGVIVLRTVSGAEFTATGKEVKDILAELGFNK